MVVRNIDECDDKTKGLDAERERLLVILNKVTLEETKANYAKDLWPITKAKIKVNATMTAVRLVDEKIAAMKKTVYDRKRAQDDLKECK